MSTVHEPPPPTPAPTGAQFVDMQNSPEFQRLRTTLRRFIFPTAIFFLGWYALYVLLGAFAHDFMGTIVFGNINIGMIFGLLQFVTTFVITGIYVRYANRELDPKATAIREKMEAEAPQ